MTKLSDTQAVILSAAAQRADLSVLPLPDSLTLKGGALNKVMDSLRNRSLVRVLGGDGGPERVVITSEGMVAIGVEADDAEVPAAADTGPTSAEADRWPARSGSRCIRVCASRTAVLFDGPTSAASRSSSRPGTTKRCSAS
jgi:hypothetical protein